MKKLIIISILAIIGFSNASAQNIIKVTRSEQEQIISLSTDQVLEVQLPQRPSNGYAWVEAASLSDKVQKTITQIGDGEFVHKPNELKSSNGRSLVGQVGTEVIKYIGASQGTTVLTLELRRPWIKNGPVIDSYSITVVSAGKYTGTYTPPVKALHKYSKALTSKETQIPGIPTSWDWRLQCTPIKDQAQCGSCWDFAGCGTFECNILIHDGVTRDISEQYIINCDTIDGNGCDGGWCPHDYWMAPQGAVYETDCPYVDASCWTVYGSNSACRNTCETYPYHETIDSYACIGGEDSMTGVPSVDSMKYHIYNHGPIWVCVDASNFSNYTGGIWTETSPAGYIDHSIDLVGWKDTTVSDGSGGYWILRNSWAAAWGISGYMYISYGSDLVGYDANYIVYKGGVSPHTIPPVANFGASVTSSCTGVIQFLDSSVNIPTSWQWDFGDGGTSNVENPLHTYATSGNYTVTLKATNNYGTNTKSKTSYITISLATPPTASGASCIGPCSVTLSASGSDILTWYDAATGGNHVNTGTSYITPILTSTTTYYVQDSIPPSTFITCGKTAMGSGGSSGGYAIAGGAHYLTFDCSTAVTLVSVTMYGNTNAPGNRTISLKNSSGIVLQSATLNILSGQHTYNLNFNIPADTNLFLVCSSGLNIYRDTSGVTYPYTTPGYISIKGGLAGSDYYYYFYNWKVGVTPTCLSPRVPVVTTINLTGINEFSEGNFEVYPNPASDMIEVSSVQEAVSSIEIYNLLGEKVFTSPFTDYRSPTTINVANLPNGMYVVEVKTEKGVGMRKFVKE